MEQIDKQKIQEMRETLRSKYNYCDKYLELASDKIIASELKWCIYEDENPGVRACHESVDVAPGTFLLPDGTERFTPWIVLVDNGYSYAEVQKMSDDEKYELACKLANRPLDDEYIEKKKRKEKWLQSGLSKKK